MRACVQPRADQQGRLLKENGAPVPCGKPAERKCNTCGDDLCESCAGNKRWGHMPLPKEAA